MNHAQLTCSVPKPAKLVEPLNVLICEPQLRSYNLPYLPALWGVLKTYWEKNTAHPGMVNWMPPVHMMESPEIIVDRFRGQQIDILGLSCYTWNWRLQCEIAKLIKVDHPECLIVAGGPHPDYKDPSFFGEHPAIDAVVVKHGEIPFTQLLDSAISHSSSFSQFFKDRPLNSIPGFTLPGMNGKIISEAQSPADHAISHYLEQKTYYEEFMNDHPQGVVVAWETSRGCPFRCSYCDWGSNTMSKVVRFAPDRLANEIEWFAKSGVRVLFSVDSNFGMFQSDVDLAKAVVQAKETYDYPKYFVYSNAKNVPERTVEITRLVVNAGLETAHTLSIQHSSMEVLEATDRKNISIDKQIEVVRALQNDGIPISVQLILGLPHDNPKLWRKTFTDLMEWGIHDGYTVTNYHLLPNAPAADPSYRAKWDIVGVERYIYDGVGIRLDELVNPLTYARGEVIVSTRSFTRDDWVQMSTESAIIRGLHNTGILQLIARYLRTSVGIDYADFYSAILDDFLPSHPVGVEIFETLHACYQRFLDDEQSMAMLPLPGAQDSNYRVEPHRWVYATACQSIESLYTDLSEFLGEQFGQLEMLKSLCDYQQAIVVNPSYDKKAGKAVSIDHDWPAYFKNEDTLIPSGSQRGRPESISGELQIKDIDWDDGSGKGEYYWQPGMSPKAWHKWFDSVATNRLSLAKCTHQHTRVLIKVS